MGYRGDDEINVCEDGFANRVDLVRFGLCGIRPVGFGLADMVNDMYPAVDVATCTFSS